MAIEILIGISFMLLSIFLLFRLCQHYDKNLERSEEQYKVMFENNPNPMWIYDRASFKFLVVNNSAIKKYGYSRAEFLKMDIFDIRPEEERIRLREFSKKNILQQSRTGIWKHLLKDGSIIITNIISHDIIFDNKPAKLVLALDVTEKELYETELERQQDILKRTNDNLNENLNQLQISQNKLSYTQKIAKIAGWTYDIDHDKLYFDQGLKELTDIIDSKINTISLTDFMNLVNPEDADLLEDFIAKIKVKKQSKECTFRIKNHSDWNYVKFKSSLYLDTEEDRSSIKGFIQDVDEITKTNIENKRLGEIANKIKNIIIIVNKENRIEWANKAFYETTGYSREEATGRRPWELIAVPDNSIQTLNFMKESLINQREFSVELESFSKAGKPYWFQIDGSPIYDEKGHYAGHITIEHEITERKQSEAQIKAQKKILKETAWINSHQIRKPLASILGIIELMQTSEDEIETKEYLDLLKICGDELDQQIKKSVQLVDTKVIH